MPKPPTAEPVTAEKKAVRAERLIKGLPGRFKNRLPITWNPGAAATTPPNPMAAAVNVIGPSEFVAPAFMDPIRFWRPFFCRIMAMIMEMLSAIKMIFCTFI